MPTSSRLRLNGTTESSCFGRWQASSDYRRHFTSSKKGRHNNRPGYKPEKTGGKKESFVAKFIEPATRGELQKGHKSGIPRLAAKKGKGNLGEDQWSTTKRANRGRAWPKFEPDSDGIPGPLDTDGRVESDSRDEPQELESPDKVRKAMEGLSPADFTDQEMAKLRSEMQERGLGSNVGKSELMEVAQRMAEEVGKSGKGGGRGKARERQAGGRGGGGDGGEMQWPPGMEDGGSGEGEESKYPPHWDPAIKNDNFFAEELWDDDKYWWREEDHDEHLFKEDKDFNVEDYYNEDGQLVGEYDKELRENPIFHKLLQDEEFEFDHNEVLDFYKKHAPPEEVEKMKNFDWSKAMVRAKEGDTVEAAEDEKMFDFNSLGDMDYSELFPDDEEGPPDINKDFFEQTQSSNNDEEGYSYIEDKFNLPRGRQRLVDTAIDMEEPEKDPEEYFYDGQFNVLDIVKRPDSDFHDGEEEQHNPVHDEIYPLPTTVGTEGTDLITAMQEHPTNYGYYEDLKVHPNQRREPRPLLIESEIEDPSPLLLDTWKRSALKHPPQEFLDTWNRFLYVTSLPPFMADKNTPADLENAEHVSRFEKFVANLCSVDSTQVSAANATSAFVGFTAPRELADAIKKGPKNRHVLVSAPTAKLYDGSDDFAGSDEVQAFVEKAAGPEAIMHIEGLRLSKDPSNSALAETLIREYFDKELFEEFGGHILAENVHVIPSSSSALVRFDSAEQADSMLKSTLFQDRLKAMATYKVQYLRARRELWHRGFDPQTKEEDRDQGSRLVVDGLHMPQRLFYISHASAVQIGHVPEGVSKRMLTEIFQPFCELPRGVEGSIEFATCELSGEPITGGPVFVGFDEPFEADICMDKLQDLKIGGHHTTMRVCKDRVIPQLDTTPRVRQTRPVEELNDEMNNWQKYVKEEDIQYLDENGVPRVILDEVFRGMRRTNNYFGVLNGPNPEESVEPDKAGTLWEDLVISYVNLLKECVVTKENPGRMYLEQFYPGQPIDLSIFDKYEIEKEEMERIRKILNSSTNTISNFQQ